MQIDKTASTFHKTLGRLALLLALAQPALAAPPSARPDDTELQRQQFESGGVLGGLAIGAIAGGPLGAIVTAAAGGWLGNQVHEARNSRSVKEELALARADLLRLQDNNLALGRQLEQSNLVASTSVQAPVTTNCCQDSAMTLHFRSNSSAIEPHYLPALREFVRLINGAQEVTVEISGHSDRRGEDQANLVLAQQRVESVEKTLRDMGLRQVRLETTARGARQPVSALEDAQGHFFDRRVQLRLRQAGHPELLSSSER